MLGFCQVIVVVVVGGLFCFFFISESLAEMLGDDGAPMGMTQHRARPTHDLSQTFISFSNFKALPTSAEWISVLSLTALLISTAFLLSVFLNWERLVASILFLCAIWNLQRALLKTSLPIFSVNSYPMSKSPMITWALPSRLHITSLMLAVLTSIPITPFLPPPANPRVGMTKSFVLNLHQLLSRKTLLSLKDSFKGVRYFLFHWWIIFACVNWRGLYFRLPLSDCYSPPAYWI